MIKWLLVAALAVSAVKAAKIDCVYSTDVILERYECEATVSHMAVPTLERVTGTHEPGKHLKDVDTLSITNQTLAALPKGIAGFFKNLKKIAVENVPLTTISASDLQGMTGLTDLNLENVNLTSLPSDLFAFTPELTGFYISSDVLAHIGPNLLSGLAQLSQLEITSPCVNKEVNEVYPALSAELSSACPPLSGPVTPPTTCACDQKIEKLHDKIQQLKDHEKADVAKVEIEAKAVAKRLKALEKHLGAFCSSLGNIF